jgi:hypothetical protein
MPTMTTSASALRAACAMVRRFCSVMFSGSPRRASFEPSSSTTTAGSCWRSSAGRRATPPLVVSPLMLALTTLYFGYCSESRADSSGTQPVPRLMPYSAARLSPTTSTVRCAEPWAAGAV